MIGQSGWLAFLILLGRLYAPPLRRDGRLELSEEELLLASLLSNFDTLADL
jgi:hypothetical protein